MPRRLLTTLACALVVTLGDGIPAQADSSFLADERGDVWSRGAGTDQERVPNRRRGDILRTVVHHTREQVVVRSRFARLDRRGRGYVLTARIRSNDVPVRVVVLQTPVRRAGIGWRGRARITRRDGTTLRACSVAHSLDYTSDVAVLRVPRGCLDNPRWVQVSATAVSLGRKDMFADDAHTDGPGVRPVHFTPLIRAGEVNLQDGEPPPAPPPTTPPAGVPEAGRVSCPLPTVRVSTATELREALASALAGDVIELSAGTYAGEFVAATSGTAERPIFLCGAPEAVLDGGDIEGGYVFHLDRAPYWRLVGFGVRNGQKGVMADGTVGSVIQDLTVSQIGDEAIHLRTNSTDNLVVGNTISHTGLRRDDYGEGIYVGTAVSNWCTYTECQPDRSDRNVIADNTITATTAEAVDIKEATTGGVISGNTFDGSQLTGADSWVDVKGNHWLIKRNTGTNSPMDGFQTHQILDGWGDYNVFRGNTARVNGPGLGFAIWPEEHNSVACDNHVEGAAEGFSNLPCT